MSQTQDRIAADKSSQEPGDHSPQVAVHRHVEVLAEFPAKALELYQRLSSAWLQRRSEDLRIGLEAAQRLSQTRDYAQANEIYAEWLRNSVARAREELTGTPEQINTLTLQYLDSLQNLAVAVPQKLAQSATTALKRVA